MPSVDLWRSYLDYVKKKGDSAVLRKAYEVAVNSIGLDKESGEIWHAYLDLIKTEPVAIT